MTELEKLSGRSAWIEWLDSSSTYGWHLPENISENMECMTLGFLVREDDESITVVASISATGHVSNPITIPRCAITKLHEVSW